MKTITINSDIFANEWAESFLKALMGNHTTDEWTFIGAGANGFICQKVECLPALDLTFNLDELSIDWACLYEPKTDTFSDVVIQSFVAGDLEATWEAELDLDYLAKQKGIEIK